jgi:Fe-S oxidoreductase
LGRYRNIYDEPRAVIDRFAEQSDPPRARERSFCCGAGGGQMFLGEEKGKRINMGARGSRRRHLRRLDPRRHSDTTPRGSAAPGRDFR